MDSLTSDPREGDKEGNHSGVARPAQAARLLGLGLLVLEGVSEGSRLKMAGLGALSLSLGFTPAYKASSPFSSSSNSRGRRDGCPELQPRKGAASGAVATPPSPLHPCKPSVDRLDI